MAFLPLRPVPIPAATEAAYDAWLGALSDALDDPATDRDELCRRTLTGLYYPQWAGHDPADLHGGARIALLQMDPRNITLEAEYYRDTDVERYARVKPLLWLWEMFDKSPAGENVLLGVRLRRLLAHHIFARCGRNFKCFHFVKFSFGYNMEVGDDVVVHRHVLLDDRGGIVLGNRVSVADYANIYSHTHALADQRDIDNTKVVIGDGARITYHATILSSGRMQPDSMVGALAVLTGDVKGGEVALGIPARPKLTKPSKAERPEHPATGDPLAGG